MTGCKNENTHLIHVEICVYSKKQHEEKQLKTLSVNKHQNTYKNTNLMIFVCVLSSAYEHQKARLVI